MLDKLIDMVISLFTNRLATGITPKGRAVRALLDLHSAMCDCHEEYLTWKHVNGKALEGKQYKQWKKKVDRLGETYATLRHKLSIMAPDVNAGVGAYFLDETFKANPHVLSALLREMDTSLIPDDSIQGIETFGEFDNSIGKLRNFIRTQFKWDDLFT